MDKDYIQYTSEDDMARATFEVALLAECVKHQCDIKGEYTNQGQPLDDPIVIWIRIDDILSCIKPE